MCLQIPGQTNRYAILQVINILPIANLVGIVCINVIYNLVTWNAEKNECFFLCASGDSLRMRGKKITHPLQDISQAQEIQQEEGKHMASQLSFLASKSHLLEKLQKPLPKIHLKSQNSTSQKNNISLQSRNNIQASKCYTVITSKNKLSRSKS